MKEYIIMSDSCVDLTQEMANDLELDIVPLTLNYEGREIKNYLDEREITNKDFYQAIREHRKMFTSQPNVGEYIEHMERYLKEGKDILNIAFSSSLSGTYNSSLVAKEELEKKYPHQKIIVIDSLCASMGQGLLLTYAANLKREGKTIEEVAEWVESNKLSLCHLFTVGDLNHLPRGGRLSSAKAFLGTLLKVKPLLHVSLEGKLVQTGKTRGRKQSLDALIERMKNTIVNPKDQIVYISHGDCQEEAEYVKGKIIEQLGVKDVVINYVGPVIGCHSGIGTLAIFYLGNDRFEAY